MKFGGYYFKNTFKSSSFGWSNRLNSSFLNSQMIHQYMFMKASATIRSSVLRSNNLIADSLATNNFSLPSDRSTASTLEIVKSIGMNNIISILRDLMCSTRSGMLKLSVLNTNAQLCVCISQLTMMIGLSAQMISLQRAFKGSN
jgi:hypothetical protein